MNNRDIAKELFISENTVKNHVRNILEKLQLHSRMEAVVYAMREKILEIRLSDGRGHEPGRPVRGRPGRSGSCRVQRAGAQCRSTSGSRSSGRRPARPARPCSRPSRPPPRRACGHGRDGLRRRPATPAGRPGCGPRGPGRPGRPAGRRPAAASRSSRGPASASGMYASSRWVKPKIRSVRGAVPDQRVERRQQRRAVPAARRRARQRRRVGPGGLRPSPRPSTGTRPRVRDHRVDLLALEPVVVREVGAGGRRPGPRPARRDQPAQALRVVEVVVRAGRRGRRARPGRRPASSRGARCRPPRRTSSSRSTAIFVSDQSHHSPPFFAPPSSVAVSGPSARSCSMHRVVGAVRQSSWCQCGRGRGRRGGGTRSAATPRSGRMQAACDQYSKACAVRSSTRASTRRRARPRRAGRTGSSSCERASTEMVSSWTAPRWRSTPADAGPPVGRAEEALGAQGDPAGLVGGEVGGWGGGSASCSAR